MIPCLKSSEGLRRESDDGDEISTFENKSSLREIRCLIGAWGKIRLEKKKKRYFRESPSVDTANEVSRGRLDAEAANV